MLDVLKQFITSIFVSINIHKNDQYSFGSISIKTKLFRCTINESNQFFRICLFLFQPDSDYSYEEKSFVEWEMCGYSAKT